MNKNVSKMNKNVFKMGKNVRSETIFILFLDHKMSIKLKFKVIRSPFLSNMVAKRNKKFLSCIRYHLRWKFFATFCFFAFLTLQTSELICHKNDCRRLSAPELTFTPLNRKKTRCGFNWDKPTVSYNDVKCSETHFPIF